VTLGSSERLRKGGKLGEILEMHPPHLRQFFFGLLYFSKYAKAAKAKVGLGT
jgi:hypothetical protein